MAFTPFHRPPLKPFLIRMLGPALGIFFISFVIMGSMAVESSSKLTRVPASRISAVGSATLQVAKFFQTFFNIPDVCWSGNAINEFEEKQCNDFWNIFNSAGIFSAIPFGATALFFLIATDQLRAVYRRGRKKMEKGEALFSGTVTDPALMPQDPFGWIFCFHSVSVELKDGRQIRVYVPSSLAVPLPGQTLAIFDGGKILGIKRHLAVVYAPHIAVVAGSRSI